MLSNLARIPSCLTSNVDDRKNNFRGGAGMARVPGVERVVWVSARKWCYSAGSFVGSSFNAASKPASAASSAVRRDDSLGGRDVGELGVADVRELAEGLVFGLAWVGRGPG